MDERRTAGRTAAVLWAISAAGLLLAVSIAPGAINMCIGVAVPAAIATAMYVNDARLAAAGVSDQRVAMHLERGVIQLDGETVTDLDTPAPDGTRIVFAGS